MPAPRTARCVLSLLALMAASTASAQTERVEKPWLLDDATRIARRFDPVLAAERAALVGTCIGEPCARRVVVDGNRNPELILPWELMNALKDAFDPDPELARHYRSAYAYRSNGLVADDAFWERFGDIAKPWLEAVWEPPPPLTIPPEELDERQRAVTREAAKRRYRLLCAMRADALDVARAAFGRCAFDRFLYEAVAPGRVVSSYDETAESAAWVEGGCQ